MSSKPRRPSLRDIVSEDIRVVQPMMAEPELAPPQLRLSRPASAGAGQGRAGEHPQGASTAVLDLSRGARL